MQHRKFVKSLAAVSLAIETMAKEAILAQELSGQIMPFVMFEPWVLRMGDAA